MLGGAAVAASAVAAAIGHRMPRRATFVVALLISGTPRFVVLAAGVPLEAIVAVFAVCGFAGGFLNPILGTVILGRIPRDLLGRVSGMTSSLAWSGIPFGGLVGGALVATAGLAPALLVCGGAYLVATMVPAFRRGWREIDR